MGCVERKEGGVKHKFGVVRDVFSGKAVAHALAATATASGAVRPTVAALAASMISHNLMRHATCEKTTFEESSSAYYVSY